MDHCITRRCSTSCSRLVWHIFTLLMFRFVSHRGFIFIVFCYQTQADWKPESADRFGDIAELVKSVGSLKIEETKSQGSLLSYLQLIQNIYLHKNTVVWVMRSSSCRTRVETFPECYKSQPNKSSTETFCISTSSC